MNDGFLAQNDYAARKIEIIIRQTRLGAVSVVILCAFYGLILIKAVGWTTYLLWYASVIATVLGRQYLFAYLLSRKPKSPNNLKVIALIVASTGSWAAFALPLFAGSLNLSDVAVLSAIMVGWSAAAVSVLWVTPEIYGTFFVINMCGVFYSWMGHAAITTLLPLAVALALGSILMFNLARLVSRQQEELDRNSAGKTRLLAAANHDLRQPAHALGLFMSRLKESPGDRTLIDGADASVKALLGMLDAYFDYSRLESRSVQIQVGSVRIQRLFDQLQVGFSEIAANSNTRLLIRPCKATIKSDPVLLQRVLLNLVSNAIKFTANGTVLVCCRSQLGGQRLRIDVLDNGIGIEKSNHERIFEEFFQCENAARMRERGVGLGLSLVSEACKLLSHQISLRSCPGHGSRFSVTVPLERWHSTQEPVVATAEVRHVPMENAIILLVEDDPLGAAALMELLKAWGYEVHTASDCNNACKLLSVMPQPDVLICDFRLPGDLNGIDTVRRLRTQCGEEIPAFLISGDVDGSAKTQAFEAGLSLLQKPVAPAKLRSLLRRIHASSKQ